MESQITLDAKTTPCPQCGASVKLQIDATGERKTCPRCGYEHPNQVAHFKLLQIIGAGGMGAVYRGLDLSLERVVAVKVMREEFARNPQFVESFLREARAAAALNHPNVAQIYSFGEENARYYLVMELLANGSLDDRIEKERRVQELDVLDVGIQVAGGLRAACERGLIHRDIKPGNILFSADGSAKVVDFGLARFEDKEEASQQEEGIWGTPYYIAPEKVSDNLEDFRSDIYSLGGTLFHALAGRAPFEAGTSTEVVLKHLHSTVASLQAWAPDCTPQTAEVIGRMLKRDPAERPQSYDELLNDLAYAKRFALEKKPLQPIEVESDFSTGMLISTLAIIVISLGVGIWLWVHPPKFFSDIKKTDGSLLQNTSTNAPPKPTAGSAQASTPPSVKPNPPKPGQGTKSGAHPPPPKPAGDKPKPPPPQPSGPNYPMQIDAAHEQAAQGKSVVATAKFDEILKSLPGNHPLQPWVKLHIARNQWLSKRGAEAVTALQGVAGATLPESFVSAVPEAQYPQFLALILLGKISSESLDKVLPGLPDWMKAIALFDAGFAAIQQTHLDEGKRLWQAYESSQVKTQSWTVAYQPMARDYANEYEQFRSTEKKITELQAAGKLQDIQTLLDENKDKWRTSTIQDHIAKLEETSRTAIARIQKEQEDKKRAEMARQIEVETRLLDPWRARIPSMLAAYQFEALLQGWKDLDPKIKTDANRKLVQTQLEVFQCLAVLKQQLAKDVAATPYDKGRIVTRAGQKMDGKLHQIKDDKLSFRIEIGGQVGGTTCSWASLPPAAFLELGSFYYMRAGQADQSQRAIALAVFARELGLPQATLQQYLDLARQNSPGAKETLEKLGFH